MRDEDARDPDAAKRGLLDAFLDLGIGAEQLKSYLGISDLATLTPKDLAELRGIFASVRDGDTTWRELVETKAQADAEKAKAAGQAEPQATAGKSKAAGKLGAAVGAKPDPRGFSRDPAHSSTAAERDAGSVDLGTGELTPAGQGGEAQLPPDGENEMFPLEPRE
jgi:hypothetical protein